MLEVQGPGGRYRLGEVIHGQKDEPVPASAPEKGVEVAAEKKEEGEQQIQDAPHPGAAPTDPQESFPELLPGESTGLEVESEMKELGVQVLICSVAWETPEGRRTFQRFLKFNVRFLLDPAQQRLNKDR